MIFPDSYTKSETDTVRSLLANKVSTTGDVISSILTINGNLGSSVKFPLDINN